MDLTAIAPPVPIVHPPLPVAEALTGLLPDGGLTRGRVTSCQGIAAASMAFALVAKAVEAGAWLAAVDLPWLGVEAVDELGVPLDRLVRIDTPDPSPQRWAELLATALDGFEVVVTQAPTGAGPGIMRRVQTRVRARSAVLVAVGDLPVPADLVLTTSATTWEQAGRYGDGHLQGRRLWVEASGRRMPRARQADLWLPAPTGGVALAEPDPIDEPLPLQSAV